MFSEYLEKQPLRALLTQNAVSFVPPARNRAAWENIPDAFRQEIGQMAAQYAVHPYPMRKATDFLSFVRTGSRAADEGPYFFRRRKLCAAALMCCLDQTAAADDVIDGIWCICEESSWVVSAHNVNPIPGAPRAQDAPLPDVEKPYIDLFSAQTGMILSLVHCLLKDRLDAVTPLIGQRIRSEVLRRIIAPFLGTDDFWWMGFKRKDLCNWTPWIVSNVMLCACVWLTEKDALAALLDRALRMLDRWLDAVPADGGCDEGAGYWNMAGGALLDCLELLEAITGGRMTFWQDEKLRNILSFPLKAEIGNGWFVNFADCDARPFLSGERLQFAGEKLGDPALTSMGIRLRGALGDQINDVPHFSRLLKLLFHPAGQEAAAPEPQDVWLPDLQLRVVRRNGMTLCCKGGHNGENHNHNDVGSFMLYVDGRPEIVDAGNMIYTAQTFSAARYSLWNVRSAYHNLPLIGGAEQQPGKEYAARDVRCMQSGLSLELAGTYDAAAGIESLRRSMELTENQFILRDQLSLRRPAPVTWIWMLRNRPSVVGNTLLSGGIRIVFPADLRYEAEEIPVTDSRMARNFPGSLWRVKLTGAPAAHTVFTVGRKNA